MPGARMTKSRLRILVRDHKAWIPDRCQHFKAAFSLLIPALAVLRRRQENLDRADAPKQNVFRMLGWQSSEVRTHSALLAEVLDPRGSHSQIDLFLNKFLSICENKPPRKICGSDLILGVRNSIRNPHHWIVMKEKPVEIKTLAGSPERKNSIQKYDLKTANSH